MKPPAREVEIARATVEARTAARALLGSLTDALVLGADGVASEVNLREAAALVRRLSLVGVHADRVLALAGPGGGA